MQWPNYLKFYTGITSDSSHCLLDLQVAIAEDKREKKKEPWLHTRFAKPDEIFFNYFKLMLRFGFKKKKTIISFFNRVRK